MKHSLSTRATTFLLTDPSPCPYLDGMFERRLVADLKGFEETSMYELLSRSGFRRNHDVVYTPVCENCRACLAVRTVVNQFKPTASQRRVERLNKNLVAHPVEAIATYEQFELFSKYQNGRHGNGDMARMDFVEFRALIEDNVIGTFVLEFRVADELLGACVVDQMTDGLSAVYSFFDPSHGKKSLGTKIVLDLISLASQRSLPFVYLGYWVSGSPKMEYKDKFKPLEYYNGRRWEALN